MAQPGIDLDPPAPPERASPIDERVSANPQEDPMTSVGAFTGCLPHDHEETIRPGAAGV